MLKKSVPSFSTHDVRVKSDETCVPCLGCLRVGSLQLRMQIYSKYIYIYDIGESEKKHMSMIKTKRDLVKDSGRQRVDEFLTYQS